MAYMLVWITDNVYWYLTFSDFRLALICLQMLFDILSGYSIAIPTVMCEHLVFNMQEKFGASEGCNSSNFHASGDYGEAFIG